jgi:hypothetical protein
MNREELGALRRVETVVVPGRFEPEFSEHKMETWQTPTRAGTLLDENDRSELDEGEAMNLSGAAHRVGAVVMGLGMFGTLSLAQPPRPALDPLAEARDKQKIADQSAESDVKDAIQAAERQAKTNKTKAVQALKNVQANIDLSASLSTEGRNNLNAMIAAKIAQIEGRPLPMDTGYKPDPAAAAIKDRKKAATENYTAELKAINEGIQRVEKLKNAGLNKEAEKEIAGLAKSYPNNPAVIRLQDQDTFGSRVEDAKEYARQQDKRITIALRNVDETALPAIRDIEFPKNWKDKDSRKSVIKLSEKEKKIIESLNKPVTVDWNGKMLEEALQELSNQMDQNLFIDKKSLTDLGLDLSKTVTLQAKGVSARTALRQILAAQGLTFVVKDEAIQVVTVEKARDMLVTRVYYLGDLAQGVGPFGQVNAGQLLNFQNTMQNVDVIMKAIQSSVDPLCWRPNGPCTITFHFPSMSIIVRASAEVHSTLGSTLNGGK